MMPVGSRISRIVMRHEARRRMNALAARSGCCRWPKTASTQGAEVVGGKRL